MSSEHRGMPLLSGPPPPLDSPRADISCRKCNKEFNVIFTRARRCNHCGFSYCSSCSDYTALMPRIGSGSGYDPVAVCAFCIDYLNITAGGRSYLRNLPLSRLRRYVDAYNIKIPGALEKDDLVNTIIAARGPDGCLPPVQEEFYRMHSVPNGRSGRPRGLFSSRQAPQPTQPSRRAASPSPAFSRPDLEARPQLSQSGRQSQVPQGSSAQRPHPYVPPNTAPPPRPHTAYGTYTAPPRPTSARANTSSQGTRSSPPRRPATTVPHPPPPPPPPPPPAPVPALDELLVMTDQAIGTLSIGTLKSVLFQNHVNARLLLEKSELVDRVMTLIEDERRERAREAAVHAQEEAEIIARQHAMMEEHRMREEERARAATNSSPAPPPATDTPKSDEENGSPEATQKTASPSPPPNGATPTYTLERNGLCVICQDEEANIAVVDCGHMAMCRACSELVMSSSRECPLCRTRIVTEARLLRIFKT